MYLPIDRSTMLVARKVALLVGVIAAVAAIGVFVGSAVSGGFAPHIARAAGSVQIEPSAYTGDPFVVDRNSIALFDEIPDEDLLAAQDLGLLIDGDVVARNIHETLDCFAAESWGASDVFCRRDYYLGGADWAWRTYTQSDLDNGDVPPRIVFFPDPTLYDGSNWGYSANDLEWSDKVRRFIEVVAPAHIDSVDVFAFQFGYSTFDEANDILDPVTGFFVDSDANYDVFDLNEFFAAYPDKTLVLWTSSLSRSVGSQLSTDFNNQMRLYAAANGMVLFDLADIESHTSTSLFETELSEACYDNRDGEEYCRLDDQGQITNCENAPSDGEDQPAICQDYTTSVWGGPLGTVSGGRILVTKALWVLMARLAGWDGGVGDDPTPTSTPTGIFTSTPTPPPTSTPTPTPTGTATSTSTSEAGGTPTLTPRITPTPTPDGSVTVTPAASGTPDGTLTASPSVTATETGGSTSTPTPDGTSVGTPGATPSATATGTLTPEPGGTTEPVGDDFTWLPSLRLGN